MILLDTDHLGITQRQTQPEFSRLAARLRQPTSLELYVSILSFHEQIAGWNVYIHRARTPEGVVRGYRMLQGILTDFATMRVLPFDEAAARTFEALLARRVRIGTMDLRIAAVAISRDLTLLSRNLADFRKVPGLDVEDWTGE